MTLYWAFLPSKRGKQQATHDVRGEDPPPRAPDPRDGGGAFGLICTYTSWDYI